MKCHYVFDKDVGKVLIPGCWSVVMSNDIKDCTCTIEPSSPEGFERKRYHDELKEKNKTIKELQKQVECLQSELNTYINLLEANFKKI